MEKRDKPKGDQRRLSVSIRKELDDALRVHMQQLRGKKSKSSVVCDAIAFFLEFNALTPMEKEDVLNQGRNVARAPEILYAKWHRSLYMRKFERYLFPGYNWVLVDFIGEPLSDEGTERMLLQDRLAGMYRGQYKKVPKGSALPSILKKVRKDDNIKVLAVRLAYQERQSGNGAPVFNLLYAVTLVDVTENINDSAHDYFDYHSIRMIDLADLYENPLRNFIRNGQGKLPVSYAHWLPIYVYHNKVLIIGVKKKTVSKKIIEEVTRSKLILVTPGNALTITPEQ
ncbi:MULTISPECIES: hypothetical protein [unclassified Serratia (in: enterobacteria)]|uniref:hypothetical protein n=1 Tax=unclassified Serratia (in: enterobacteria) TaxID=2647522 RepID=UPI003076422A